MKLTFVTSVLVASLLALTATSYADVVTTSGGSRIVGKVEKWASGKVTIVTEFAGTLTIKAEKVTSLTIDTPIAVQFASGDRLVGTITTDEETGRTVMQTALGPVAIRIEQITSAWSPDSDSPDVVVTKAEAAKAKEALTPKWSATLEAGAVFTEGNTNTLDGRGRLEVHRKTKDDLLSFLVAGEYSERDDKRNKNEYRAGMRYEHSLSERSFWFVRSLLEFDEFENLDLRATTTGGAGYYWRREPQRELKTSLGVGYRHEAFKNGVTTDEVVVDLGLYYRHELAPWAVFKHTSTYTPDVQDFADYRLEVDTALVLPMKNDVWKLKLGVRNEYNSRPLPGIDRLDSTYYANVVLELK